MTETAHETPALEMQFLTAQDGTAYLLPRALLEAARLTPEAAAAFSAAAEGDDVQGLMFGPIGMSGSLKFAALPTPPPPLGGDSHPFAGRTPEMTRTMPGMSPRGQSKL